MLRTARKVHAPKTDSNSARGDNYDTVAGGAQTACCFDNEGEDGEERLVSFLVDYGRGAYGVLVRCSLLDAETNVQYRIYPI